MQHIIISAFLAFIITYFAIPVIIQIAKSKKLFDEPDERKVHKGVIPTLGGLGIFAGFIIATLMGAPDAPELKYFAAATIVIFFLGLKDDILVLSANKKFIGQVIASFIIMHFGNIYLNDMHGFLGINIIPYYASVFLTMFTIIVITNAFNLIDGIDGLAGSLGFITTLVFSVYFYYANELTYAVMAISLATAIFAFLIYNFSPAKIFMGDTGSLIIGLINSILVIKFINVAGVEGQPFSLHAAPALGFAVLIVPLFDTLRVFGLRILDRRSPFSPDRVHVHHYLLDLGFSHKKITYSLIAITVLFITTAFTLRNYNCTLVIGLLMVLATGLMSLLYFKRQKVKVGYEIEPQQSNMVTNHNIFSFTTEPVEVE